MKVVVNGTGMEMFANYGSHLPVFAFSEPIIENPNGMILISYIFVENFLDYEKGLKLKYKNRFFGLFWYILNTDYQLLT